jgi:hypothetical protein
LKARLSTSVAFAVLATIAGAVALSSPSQVRVPTFVVWLIVPGFYPGIFFGLQFLGIPGLIVCGVVFNVFIWAIVAFGLMTVVAFATKRIRNA